MYDRSTNILAYTLIAIPGFFLSYILIQWVVDTFGVPVIGMKTFGMEHAQPTFRFMDRVWHLVIPSVMSGILGVAVLSRYVRSQMLEVISQDYVRTARAKGVLGRYGDLLACLTECLAPVCDLVGIDASWAHWRIGDFRNNICMAWIGPPRF